MRTKNFLFIISVGVSVTLFIIFGQNKPETFQNIVTTTNQQIRNFKDNLRDAESKKLVADDKYLDLLGFVENPRLFPNDVWRNTSLPVVATYVLAGQESQAIGLINNIARILPNNTIIIYNLGLSDYSLKTLINYCNSSKCQIFGFDFYEFPSHIDNEKFHAFRPLIIQDALRRTGAILFLENSFRLKRHVTHATISDWFENKAKVYGIMAWPLKSKNPVTSFTHKNMFEYFHTDSDAFIFQQMVSADVLLIVNTESIHKDIMMPWVQCALTLDCIEPIGAQSVGCNFNKRPIFRYSGCHSYDISALNIVLGLKFKQDASPICDKDSEEYFEVVPLHKAVRMLREFEQNTTTDGRFSSLES